MQNAKVRITDNKILGFLVQKQKRKDIAFLCDLIVES